MAKALWMLEPRKLPIALNLLATQSYGAFVVYGGKQ